MLKLIHVFTIYLYTVYYTVHSQFKLFSAHNIVTNEPCAVDYCREIKSTVLIYYKAQSEFVAQFRSYFLCEMATQFTIMSPSS